MVSEWIFKSDALSIPNIDLVAKALRLKIEESAAFSCAYLFRIVIQTFENSRGPANLRVGRIYCTKYFRGFTSSRLCFCLMCRPN